MMVGGLDLVTPPIAMPPGKAISAINYEPDVAGYTSFGGYERFDGQPRPSDATDPVIIAESRREAIKPVPGTGPVRGVWVFDGDVYAFRDQTDGVAGGMFQATGGGWVQHDASATMLQFVAGDRMTSSRANTSSARPRWRPPISTGSCCAPGHGTAAPEGFLIVSKVTGTFADRSHHRHVAAARRPGLPTRHRSLIQPGGRYDFTNHNFYGAATAPACISPTASTPPSSGTAQSLAPIRTGDQSAATADRQSISLRLTNGDFHPRRTMAIRSIIMSALFDAPSFIAHYKNHLFLGYYVRHRSSTPRSASRSNTSPPPAQARLPSASRSPGC